MRAVLLFTMTLIGFVHAAPASETDPFSVRFQNIPDVTDALDAEVNARLREAVQRTNLATFCDRERLFRELGGLLLRPVVGRYEGWVLSSGLPSASVPLRDSIYGDLSITENPPVHLGKLGLGNTYRVNGVLIGNDKFGHFFDEGHTYLQILRGGGRLEDALNKGRELESGFYGTTTSKVLSYGDQVANYQGVIFWSNVLGEGLARGKEPYIKCFNDNRFIQVRKFTWRDYVDEGWDESINCSSYANASVTARVTARIQNLERRAGRRLTCPVTPASCVNLRGKYQNLSPWLLHPLCLNAR